MCKKMCDFVRIGRFPAIVGTMPDSVPRWHSAKKILFFTDLPGSLQPGA
jgi:hypothetical protein